MEGTAGENLYGYSPCWTFWAQRTSVSKDVSPLPFIIMNLPGSLKGPWRKVPKVACESTRLHSMSECVPLSPVFLNSSLYMEFRNMNRKVKRMEKRKQCLFYLLTAWIYLLLCIMYHRLQKDITFTPPQNFFWRHKEKANKWPYLSSYHKCPNLWSQQQVI